jgi:trehalose 6-phosphate phosphatase
VTQRPSTFEQFVHTVGSRLGGSPLAVMLDVDGTLAPIAPSPEEAVVPEETRELLRRLVSLRGVHVALVSGRSASDAWRMTSVPGTWIIGNHGLEFRAPDGGTNAVTEVREYEHRIAEASSALNSVTRATPGAIVENKRWTISVHYRQADSRAVPALIARTRDVGVGLGLRVTEGKKIVELRPPVDLDKGTAALTLLDRVGAAAATGSMLYAGDDRTDEDAFRALKVYSARAVTIRITGRDDPAPPSTVAEFTLATTTELQRVLGWLIDRRAS